MPSRNPTLPEAFFHAAPAELRVSGPVRPGEVPGRAPEAAVASDDRVPAGGVADEAAAPLASVAAAAAAAASAAAAIDWLPWDRAAFARAQATGRPVLLSVVTTWSAACRVQDAALFGDPPADAALARLLRESTVPVRVDADRRPDIAERYTCGGWPTLLLLTPEGDILAGGADPTLDAARLTRLVTAAVSALTSRRHELALQAQRLRVEADAAASLADAHVPGREGRRHEDGDKRADEGEDESEDASADAALAWITDRLLAAFDRDHGGFRLDALDPLDSLDPNDPQDRLDGAAGAAHAGTGAKFPLAAPLAFAMWQGMRTEDDRLLEAALITLRRMASGGLSAADGAFHRACAGADWSAPDRAKLLETQAELIPLYIDGWTLSGDTALRDRARACLDFVFAALADGPRAGFFASLAPDGVVDRILLTDANAKMIGALVRAGQALEDGGLIERAAQALERLLPVVYQRRAGVAHLLLDGGGSADPARTPREAGADAVSGAGADRAQVRGLLADQVHISAALLDTGAAIGERVYIELAEELMRSALRRLAHPAGGFADRVRSAAGAGDIGLLAMPLRPFAANAAAARVLARLGREADRPDLLDAARATLRALTPMYRQHDVLSAELGLALLTLC